jgi:dipeptidyl aminopeptidase/acylaminoacyl peptidase
MWHKRVGEDKDFLWSRSPPSRVDDIRIPILIAQGENDLRMKRAESEQIVAAMAERGLDHEYVMYENEGHRLVKPENRPPRCLDDSPYSANRAVHYASY